MSRFVVGEIAIIAKSGVIGFGFLELAESNVFNAGQECEVLAVGPFQPGYSFNGDGHISLPADYIVELGGDWCGVAESALRKRRPPGSEIATQMLKDIEVTA